MTRKKTLQDIDLAGKRVLVRVDYNVPFHPGTTEISDDGRIKATLPTLRYLMDNDCRTVICSHLGRPRGMFVEDMRLAPICRRLSDLLGVPVTQASDCVGAEVKRAAASLSPGQLMLLENLRFHAAEERNDGEFASELASLADVYVDDAFGTAHRAHASTEGVTRHLPSVAGFLMARELEMLGQALESPRRPFVAIFGGAKVSDKIAILERLADRVDTVIIGGGMAATFLKAKGLEVGDSIVESDRVEFAARFIERSQRGGPTLLLPEDVVIADSFSATADHRTVDVTRIPPGWMIMDIGPSTVPVFEDAIAHSQTIVWNGPMGVFEWESFSQGTAGIARVLATLGSATTVVGGGSTAEAVDSLGLAGKMTHVSTGGGASLEFLGGRILPGVAALMDKDE